MTKRPLLGLVGCLKGILKQGCVWVDLMSLLYKAYTALSSGIVVAGLPPFWLYTRLTGRFRRGFEERLGLFRVHDLRRGHPSRRIWIHAASLGEVRVARSIVNSLEKLVLEVLLRSQ